MKRFILFTVLFASLTWADSYIETDHGVVEADPTLINDASWAVDTSTNTYQALYGDVVTFDGWSYKTGPTYIKSIDTVYRLNRIECDTVLKKVGEDEYKVQIKSCDSFYVMVIDTVMAEKELVYFTPAQKKKLMEILGDE